MCVFVLGVNQVSIHLMLNQRGAAALAEYKPLSVDDWVVWSMKTAANRDI
jgi:low temperature requirement protein LtrA